MDELPDMVLHDAAVEELDPYPYYRAMRAHHPVHYDRGQAAWLVFRHADVERVLTDYQTFSSRIHCCDFTDTFHSFYRMDPPELQRYRGLVSQVFTPLAVQRLAERVTRNATELLDRVAERGQSERGQSERGQMDVIADLAFPLPLRVMADLLGLPPDEYDRYAPWSRTITRECDVPMTELREYLRELSTVRRHALRPGIIRSLSEARLDGRPLTEAEVLGFCGQLFAGANVEITPFLGNVVQCLIEHPEVAEALRAEPQLTTSAIEEMLRYYPPIPTSGPRGATTDVELGGQRIRAGQRVIPMLTSANRDETVFADPDRFDPRRHPNLQLSFSTGPHVCIGAHLSRLETRIVLTALLERFGDIQLAAGATLSPAGMLGVEHFPIVVRSFRS
jgi:cytochrome P450